MLYPPLRTLPTKQWRPEDLLQDILTSFHVGRGILTVMAFRREDLEGREARNAEAWPDETEEVTSAAEGAFPQLELLRNLVGLQYGDAHRPGIPEAVNRLFSIMSLLQRRPKAHSNARLIQTWPMHADASLFTMWEVRDSLALVTLASYAALSPRGGMLVLPKVAAADFKRHRNQHPAATAEVS